MRPREAAHVESEGMLYRSQECWAPCRTVIERMVNQVAKAVGETNVVS